MTCERRSSSSRWPSTIWAGRSSSTGTAWAGRLRASPGQEFHDEVTGADGTIAFFTLDAGLMLGLYERTNLAKDASLPAGPPSSTEFSLGVPATSQAEVDQLLAQAEAAGGTVTAPAHMRPFGVYSGYFTDPDGHLFEIAWDSNQ